MLKEYLLDSSTLYLLSKLECSLVFICIVQLSLLIEYLLSERLGTRHISDLELAKHDAVGLRLCLNKQKQKQAKKSSL